MPKGNFVIDTPYRFYSHSVSVYLNSKQCILIESSLWKLLNESSLLIALQIRMMTKTISAFQ